MARTQRDSHGTIMSPHPWCNTKARPLLGSGTPDQGLPGRPAESGKTQVSASLPIREDMARPRDAPVTSQERPCSSLSPLARCTQGLGNQRGRGQVVPLGQDG